MSAHIACSCGRKKNDHADLVVVVRNGNNSAFNGYHWTHSDYSQIRCERKFCMGSWRTKAAYTAILPDSSL